MSILSSVTVTGDVYGKARREIRCDRDDMGMGEWENNVVSLVETSSWR